LLDYLAFSNQHDNFRLDTAVQKSVLSAGLLILDYAIRPETDL